jgi:hypothetical protein
MNYIVDVKAYREVYGANPSKSMPESYVKKLVTQGLAKDVADARLRELESSGRIAEITNDGLYFVLRF